ncbi:hypothetical protein Y032_0086g1928 [Ancylostoma ceylanicum]|uniref:Uncharacterized protein n=1 Tax=Ancylostoma ceylanicum TaxID=53326 RepID=A0A016TPW9_9BILA|nr:hypothetical protein Y032_0086g1928 [Ancylostoma ceylanicum]
MEKREGKAEAVDCLVADGRRLLATPGDCDCLDSCHRALLYGVRTAVVTPLGIASTSTYSQLYETAMAISRQVKLCRVGLFGMQSTNSTSSSNQPVK